MKKIAFFFLFSCCLHFSNIIAQDFSDSFLGAYLPCMAHSACQASYVEKDNIYICIDGQRVSDCEKCPNLTDAGCQFVPVDYLERVKPPKGKDCLVFKVNGKANKLKALPDLSRFDGSSNPIKECSFEAFFTREKIIFNTPTKKMMGEKVFYAEKSKKASKVYFYYPKMMEKNAIIRFSIHTKQYQMTMVKGKFDPKTLLHVAEK